MSARVRTVPRTAVRSIVGSLRSRPGSTAEPAPSPTGAASLDDVRTLYGLASVVPSSMGSPTTMGGVMLAWIIVPLALANWRFKP